jgi:hypothetical protein
MLYSHLGNGKSFEVALMVVAMNYEVICIDHKNNDGKWQKRWSELGAGIDVCDEPDFDTRTIQVGSLDKVILVILHASVFEGRPEAFTRFKQCLRNLRIQPYLMSVNSSGMKPDNSVDWRNYRTAVQFPNSASLSHLKEPLALLLERLKQIPRQADANQTEIISARREAWDYWVKLNRGGSLLPALAILCQGFLLAHARYNSETEEWEPEEITAPLNQMGLSPAWNGFEQHGETSNEIDRKTKVSSNEWWARPLGLTGDSDSFSRAFSEIERAIRGEWNEAVNGSLPDSLKEIVGRLKRRENLTSPGMIADAYCALVNRLSGKAGK